MVAFNINVARFELQRHEDISALAISFFNLFDDHPFAKEF